MSKYNSKRLSGEQVSETFLEAGKIMIDFNAMLTH